MSLDLVGREEEGRLDGTLLMVGTLAFWCQQQPTNQ